MRVLHVVDHSIPLPGGYTFRTCSILREQRALGWGTFHVTSSKQHAGEQIKEAPEDLLRAESPWSEPRMADRHDVESERHWRGGVARYQAVYGRLAKRPLNSSVESQAA